MHSVSGHALALLVPRDSVLFLSRGHERLGKPSPKLAEPLVAIGH